MTPKQFAILNAEQRRDSVARFLREVEAELEKARAQVDDPVHRSVCGKAYRAKLKSYTAKQLQEDAYGYSHWLAEKVHGRGPGAVADSGEAHICALLDELANRL